MHLTPNWQARRIGQLLEALRNATTPRVRAAIFSTIWNRWNTHRRWQRRHYATNTCLFRCSPTAEDSIEHYCCCGTVKEAMRRHLRLDPFYYANIHTFTLCNTHINDMETLTTVALLIYGTYTTTNALRNCRPNNVQDHSSFAYDMLIQNIRNGAMNHRSSARTLDNRWASNQCSTPIVRKASSHAHARSDDSIADGRPTKRSHNSSASRR
jgi:hypothetical protein